MHQSLNSVEYNLQYSCLVRTVEDMVDWHQEEVTKMHLEEPKTKIFDKTEWIMCVQR
jgi:hypothetical protein